MNVFSNINSIISYNVINRNNSYININQKNNLENKFLEILKATMNNDNVHIKKNNHYSNSINSNNSNKNINNINNNIEDSIQKINNNNFLNISSLIGHNVLISGSKIIHIENKDIIYGYFLPQDTTFTFIKIKDMHNNLIFSHKINNQKSGNYLYYWNGKIDDKNVVSTGVYNLSILANNNIHSFDIEPFVHGIIKGIEKISESGKYIVNLGLMGTVKLEDVKRIF
ncbi:hypothetical protein [Buchnera aphidicola]|uniref:FlgD immunoglobulin-like domain containing protein n=1 Tax=Buchnera aphidicola TaxID=9 RepID=UPI0034642071